MFNVYQIGNVEQLSFCTALKSAEKFGRFMVIIMTVSSRPKERYEVFCCMCFSKLTYILFKMQPSTVQIEKN